MRDEEAIDAFVGTHAGYQRKRGAALGAFGRRPLLTQAITTRAFFACQGPAPGPDRPRPPTGPASPIPGARMQEAPHG